MQLGITILNQQAKVAKADKIGSDYVEHLLAQDGKFIDSAGHAVKFDDKAIAQLKDALKSKVPEDLDATVIATMIREETRKQENTVGKSGSIWERGLVMVNAGQLLTLGKESLLLQTKDIIK